MAFKLSRASVWGIILGVFYGLCLRLMMDGERSEYFAIMSVGFIFFVPIGLGMLAVNFKPNPSWLYSIFGPWIPVLFLIGITFALGLEGAICIIMAAPVFMLMSSIGGVLAKLFLNLKKNRRTYVVVGFLFLPFISSGIESQFVLPSSQRTVPSQIVINAPVDVVWKNIIEVKEIQPAEHRFSFYHLIGFPRPIAATLSHEGVGGVRQASFEKGLLFVETITDWQENKKIVFSIKADTNSIPPTTLDEHVTIGGEYFDMLQGEYDIEPLGENQVRLHLSSTQRLSTRFNAYTALWTESIMRSIQEYILVIIKQRCEATQT